MTLTKGEIVYLRRAPMATGSSTKLQPRYRGPMIVTAVCAGDTYKLADLHQEQGHLYATTAHISALKRVQTGNESDREIAGNESDGEVAGKGSDGEASEDMLDEEDKDNDHQ